MGGFIESHLKLNDGRLSFPIIPSDSSLQDDNIGRPSFSNVISASSGKVVDPVTLQIWAFTSYGPSCFYGGWQFSDAKILQNISLTSNHSTSNAAIDKSVKVLKKYWGDYADDSEDPTSDDVCNFDLDLSNYYKDPSDTEKPLKTRGRKKKQKNLI